ncbi:RHS repeat domain-containing protein [Streptomyces griseoluteus]|uniref:RHS repeat domain-containing protein n=1 Tax=Streptomyces griseoluteus TaxID=29306 RepID=UPI0036F9634B
MTDPNGKRPAYAYDALGRPTAAGIFVFGTKMRDRPYTSVKYTSRHTRPDVPSARWSSCRTAECHWCSPSLPVPGHRDCRPL